MLGSIALGISTGIIANLGYDGMFSGEDVLKAKVEEAYESASNVFYNKYGDEYGDELSSFLVRQQNIDVVVKSLFYGSDDISEEMINKKSFDGYKNVTSKVVIDFINILEDEFHKDFYLDKILTEKAFINDTRKEQYEIKQELKKHNKGIEGLKAFFGDALDKSITTLRKKVGLDIAISQEKLSSPNSDYSPPPLVLNGSIREKTISGCVEELNKTTWLHIIGGIGTGKTQLLSLISDSYKGKKIWLSMSGLEEGEVITKINTSLAEATNTQLDDSEDWLSKAISKLELGDILIFDDFLTTLSNSKLNEMIVNFTQKCAQEGVILLSSGTHDINSRVKHQLGSKTAISKHIPGFSKDEVIELLMNYGAPKGSAEKLSEWLSIVTKSNPSLLHFISEYLAYNKWEVTSEVFNTINNAEYANELTSEIQSVLVENINDDAAKELLYRLSIIEESFRKEDLEAVSGVQPKINHPFEKLNLLIGNWITLKSNNYILSPLVYKIGEQNLDHNIKRGVHSSLAELIKSQKILSPVEGLKLINHLMRAEEFEEVGMTFLNLLLSLEEQDITKDYWGITKLWKETSLPEEVNYDLQILIRVKQYILLRKYNDDTEFVLQELLDMIYNKSYKSTSAHTVPFLSCLLAIQLFEFDNLQSMKLLKKALTNYGSLPTMDNLENGMEELIWISTYYISTIEETEAWVDLIQSLSSEQILNLSKSEIYPMGSLAIVNNVWLGEVKKEKEQRDWQLILKVLNNIERAAMEVGLELLHASTIRAFIIVKAEYLDDLESAKEMALTFLDEYNYREEAIFLIHSILGKQYYISKKFDIAFEHYNIAISNKADDYVLENIDVYLEMATCKGELGALDKATNLIHKAIAIATKTDYIPSTIHSTLYGELAISLWKEDEKQKSLMAFETAAELLVQSKDRGGKWKNTLSILVHVITYYSSMVNTGEPPQADGGYWEPFRGAFSSGSVELEEFFKEHTDVHIYTILFMFAESLEDYNKAKKWLFSGYDLIMTNKIENDISTYHLLCSTSYLILDNKIEEAIENSINAQELAVASYSKASDSFSPLKQIDRDGFFNTNPKLQRLAYYKGIRSSLIMIMLYANLLKVRGESNLNSVVTKVLEVAKKQTTVHNELWSFIKIIFENVSEENVPAKNISNMMNYVDEDYKVILQSLSRLAAANHCSPQTAMNLHLSIIGALEAIALENNHRYQMIFRAYFKEFWTDRYIRQRDMFDNRELIDLKFRVLLADESNDVVKKILVLLNEGLGCELPDM